MALDEIQIQIDEITQRLDEMDSTFQDFSDTSDSNLNDMSENLDETVNNIEELNNNSGQLTFPLTQDTIDLITEQTPTMLQYLYNNNYIGTATLISGSVTILSNLISSTSLVMVSRKTAGGALGHLSYNVLPGQLEIVSSDAADISTVIYFILT